MNKLGDVVFCVDCDRERQAHLEISAAAEAAEVTEGAEVVMSLEADSRSPAEDKHPRRMATKKDANGDPLCSQCLDDRQAKRRAEFMLSDDRRTVVHWPRPGRASDPKPALLSSTDAAADPPAGSRVVAVTATTMSKPAKGARSRLAKLPRQNATKSKAAFVRSLPPGTPARDVIAQAKKQGLEISPAYVYVIRSTDGTRKSSGDTPQAPRETRSKSNGQALRPLNDRPLNDRPLNDRPLNDRPLNDRPLNGQALNGRVLKGSALDIRALRIPKPKDRGIERKFMWLAVELGFLRTEQLLDELRTKIKVVFAH
jgi:hypothetical protein